MGGLEERGTAMVAWACPVCALGARAAMCGHEAVEGLFPATGTGSGPGSRSGTRALPAGLWFCRRRLRLDRRGSCCLLRPGNRYREPSGTRSPRDDRRRSLARNGYAAPSRPYLRGHRGSARASMLHIGSERGNQDKAGHRVALHFGTSRRRWYGWSGRSERALRLDDKIGSGDGGDQSQHEA